MARQNELVVVGSWLCTLGPSNRVSLFTGKSQKNKPSGRSREGQKCRRAFFFIAFCAPESIVNGTIPIGHSTESYLFLGPGH